MSRKGWALVGLDGGLKAFFVILRHAVLSKPRYLEEAFSFSGWGCAIWDEELALPLRQGYGGQAGGRRRSGRGAAAQPYRIGNGR